MVNNPRSDETFREPTTPELLAGPLGDAIDAMLAHGEPFPVVVIDRWYNLARANRGGGKLLALAGVDLGLHPKPNLLTMLFDPQLRDAILNWEDLAGLLTTITVFRAPTNVTLEELQIETYIPLDDVTRSFFAEA